MLRCVRPDKAHSERGGINGEGLGGGGQKDALDISPLFSVILLHRK